MSDPKQTVIKVVGLGGGGSNAVNRMIELGIDGIDFVAANTDAQALRQSLAPSKIQLGPRLTRGLGAGGKPEVGAAAADESRDEVKAALEGADMVFLTAGLGGGTGTGAIPVVAEVARATGALTIAIVTTPFGFEAGHRQRNAEAGLARLRPHADTLITVPNDRLLALLPRSTALDLSLRYADEVLRQGVQGIAELVSRPGLINVDFAHIRALMKLSGGAMMAIGQGRGEGKAVEAVTQALKMPLLDVRSVDGAGGVLVHFTGGEDLGLYEISQAADVITRAAPGAEVVFGATIDPMMSGRAQVILVATGLGGQPLSDVMAHASDVLLRRPATSTDECTTHPMALAAEEPAVHLAEALFSQAIAGAQAPDEPWVVTGAPNPTQRLNDLDVPAFLRRRRSLRDIERSQ
jgi:cell division protein FtsZ